MSNLNVNDFITTCPIKSPSRTYKVIYNNPNEGMKVFVSPRGFQYDRYFSDLFPGYTQSGSINSEGVLEIIITSKDNKEIARILGLE